jgi:hypothetical protein
MMNKAEVREALLTLKKHCETQKTNNNQTDPEINEARAQAYGEMSQRINSIIERLEA